MIFYMKQTEIVKHILFERNSNFSHSKTKHVLNIQILHLEANRREREINK